MVKERKEQKKMSKLGHREKVVKCCPPGMTQQCKHDLLASVVACLFPACTSLGLPTASHGGMRGSDSPDSAELLVANGFWNQ